MHSECMALQQFSLLHVPQQWKRNKATFIHISGELYYALHLYLYPDSQIR
jgi:hypothetical protein